MHKIKQKNTPERGFFYSWWLWSECNSHPPKNWWVGPFHYASLRYEPRFVSDQKNNRKQKTPQKGLFLFLVALVGIEPTLLAELDFESSASTSSATEPLTANHRIYFAAAFFASTFFTKRALRVGL